MNILKTNANRNKPAVITEITEIEKIVTIHSSGNSKLERKKRTGR